MNDDPKSKLDLCAECARRGDTCCQSAEIYLTLGDVARIEAHTGQTDFHEWRDQDEPGYYSPDDDPLWCCCTIRPDGQRRFLKRSENGECAMLTPAGCRLPLDARPLVCRLHPWHYGDEGLRGIAGQHCPTDLLPEGVTVVEIIGIAEEQAEVWHAMLFQEILREYGLS